MYFKIGCEDEVRTTFATGQNDSKVCTFCELVPSGSCFPSHILTIFFVYVGSEIRVTMDTLYERGQKLRNDRTEMKKQIYEKLNYTEQRLLLLTQQMKDKIQQMVNETEDKASCE